MDTKDSKENDEQTDNDDKRTETDIHLIDKQNETSNEPLSSVHITFTENMICNEDLSNFADEEEG